MSFYPGWEGLCVDTSQWGWGYPVLKAAARPTASQEVLGLEAPQGWGVASFLSCASSALSVSRWRVPGSRCILEALSAQAGSWYRWMQGNANENLVIWPLTPNVSKRTSKSLHVCTLKIGL